MQGDLAVVFLIAFKPDSTTLCYYSAMVRSNHNMPSSARAHAKTAIMMKPTIMFHRQLEMRFIRMKPITTTIIIAIKYFKSSIMSL